MFIIISQHGGGTAVSHAWCEDKISGWHRNDWHADLNIEKSKTEATGVGWRGGEGGGLGGRLAWHNHTVCHISAQRGGMDLQSLYIHLLIIHMHQEMMQRHISHFRRSRRYSSPGERINEEQQQQHTWINHQKQKMWLRDTCFLYIYIYVFVFFQRIMA